MEPLLVASATMVLGMLAVFAIIGFNVKIARPDEILVFSGRMRQLPNGTILGYRIIQGGRGFRIPLLEKVDRLSPNLMPIDLVVEKAPAKDGTLLTVNATANVKISTAPQHLANAIERFLSKRPEEIQAIARGHLEGVLYNVLALLAPEDVMDRLKFDSVFLAQVDGAFETLGLQLDTFVIQRVEGG